MSIFILVNPCTVSFLLEKNNSRLKEKGHEGRIHHFFPFFFLLLLLFVFVWFFGFFFFLQKQQKSWWKFSSKHGMLNQMLTKLPLQLKLARYHT